MHTRSCMCRHICYIRLYITQLIPFGYYVWCNTATIVLGLKQVLEIRSLVPIQSFMGIHFVALDQARRTSAVDNPIPHVYRPKGFIEVINNYLLTQTWADWDWDIGSQTPSSRCLWKYIVCQVQTKLTESWVSVNCVRHTRAKGTTLAPSMHRWQCACLYMQRGCTPWA